MKDFVTFEIAKKLKEKGFPQVKKNTLAMYDEDGYWYSLAATIDVEYCFEDFDDYDCVCPTISQVLKWLREEKNLHICISIGLFSDFEYEISEIEGNVYCYSDDKFSTYEQAALAGIEYVLDNLI